MCQDQITECQILTPTNVRLEKIASADAYGETVDNMNVLSTPHTGNASDEILDEPKSADAQPIPHPKQYHCHPWLQNRHSQNRIIRWVLLNIFYRQ